MENSAFIPPQIANPRLVVLGATAEDAAHTTGRRSSRQSRQKEEKAMGTYPMHPLYHGPNALPVFNNPQMFPHPAMRPTIEDGHRLMNPLGAGAFRPFQVPEDQEGFYHHSAFVPAKLRKTENGKVQTVSNSEDWSSVQTCSTENSDKGSETMLRHELDVKHEIEDSDFSERGETPSSFESADRSQGVDSEITDRSSPEEGRTLRRKRKCSYLLDGQMCCSVCGVTVRPGELQTHLNQEIERLNKMTRSGRRSRDGSGCRKGPHGSSRRSKENPSSSDNPETRFETFLKIKANRQARLNARVGRSRRGRPSLDECSLTHCPICDEVLEGSAEERNNHAECCLRKQHHISAAHEDVTVDVEGEEYEEYTWCGQTRIRATTMLQSGFKGIGFQSRNPMDEDVDGNLNVDGDDTAEYGHAQYTEADIIPCSSDEPMEERQRQAIRGVLLTGEASSSKSPSLDKWEQPESSSQADKLHLERVDTDEGVCSSSCIPPSANTLIESLKWQLQDMKESKKEVKKCLICMEGYTTPLVSVQCWHVHCQECWLHTLGAKKLCPQCNMITSPGQLRKIYL